MRELVRRNPGIMRILEDSTDTEIVTGDLKLDLYKKQVMRAGKQIPLTAREFDIFAFLAGHRGEVFSHRQIYEAVWNKKFFHDTANITAHIGHIRRKLEKDPGNPQYIRTVHGAGYKFDVSDMTEAGNK